MKMRVVEGKSAEARGANLTSVALNTQEIPDTAHNRPLLSYKKLKYVAVIEGGPSTRSPHGGFVIWDRIVKRLDRSVPHRNR